MFVNNQGFRVGKEGYVFLVKALMDIEASYEKNNPETLKIAESWFKVLLSRLDASVNRGYAFRQIIIPEKISLANEFFCREIPAKSPLLHRIENTLSIDKSASNVYVSAYDILRPHSYSTPAGIARIDTHLTSFGSYIMFCAIFRSLGMDMPVVTFPESATFECDVGKMLTGVPVFEIDWLPIRDGWTAEPELIEKYDPPGGGHFTTRRGWRCPSAPIDSRVLVIGNSYFGWGNHCREMSWWGARIFTEFHFVWGHHFNYDDIERVKPNIVVGQTIERYLGTPAWA